MSTVAEARQQLAVDRKKGTTCPCCDQFAKVYRRKINAGIARVLVAMYLKAETQWTYLPHVDYRDGEKPRSVGHSGESCMARFWGLIEQYPDMKRPDGSSRVGWWRLTPLGVAFVLGEASVAKWALVYNGEPLGLDDSETVTVFDALADKFNYAELMSA